MTDRPLRILVPFADDSTLFFAARMREILKDTKSEVLLAQLVTGSDVSYRQLTNILPQGPDILLRNEAFRQVVPLQEFDVIITSRMFAPLRDMMRKFWVRQMADRPCILAFQGGLDFDPERGFFNRRFADGVFLVPKGDITAYESYSESIDAGRQFLGFGHPVFLRPGPASDLGDRRDVYFFAQAQSPRSLTGRMHVLRMLTAIARANPDRTVWLKLRHLPHENLDHLHREEFAYPDLMADQAFPDNLKLTADPMDEVLERAAVGITCTSTAAVDLVRAGVPTLIYLDYVENYFDPLVEPMRRLFEASGLVAPLEQVLNLEARPPDPAWLETFFTTPKALADDVMAAIAHFRSRPVAIRSIVPPLEADL
ncbi:MAG: hypothetical protein QNJ16_05975 [Rhodobacter sp.]|nr:hypothetical protein [Rhodobacter sp.]